MNNFYKLICDLDLLALEINHTIKENHISATLVDRSNFVSKDSRCQMDTYQVFELNLRGFITINIYFFQPELAIDKLEVKFTIISPLWNGSSMKMRKIQREIDNVIHTHMD